MIWKARGEYQMNLLLIEDDPAGVMLFNAALRDQELPATRLVIARDGESAMPTAQGAPSPLDLIVLDLNLPRRHGFEVLADIRSDTRLKSTPVCILTTSDYEPDMRRAYELGANFFLHKPADLDSFTTMVRRLILFCAATGAAAA